MNSNRHERIFFFPCLNLFFEKIAPVTLPDTLFLWAMAAVLSHSNACVDRFVVCAALRKVDDKGKEGRHAWDAVCALSW